MLGVYRNSNMAVLVVKSTENPCVPKTPPRIDLMAESLNVMMVNRYRDHISQAANRVENYGAPRNSARQF